jgi:restriction system protein
MKNIILIVILFLFLLPANCFSASDKIYSWIDEEGVQHFSDTPTYSVKQESKGTDLFLIDRHGKKQVIKPQRIIETEASNKSFVKQVTFPKTKPNLKFGQLNLNVFELFTSSILPIVYPVFLFILLIIFLKLLFLFFLKGSKLKIIKFLTANDKKHKSCGDWNSPDTNSSEFKGFEGEQTVVAMMYGFLDREKYYFFNDLILPKDEGTTQIDHLIVSEYGIFIIETKNMKGSIYGNPYEKTWIQWLADGKHPFQNPFHQNYKHKKCIEELLKIESDVYFDVIVFMECAKFPKGQPDHVFYPKELIRFVKSQTKTVLSGNEIERILSVLESSIIEPSFEAEKRHKEYVTHLFNGK